jgi:O-methyltransferase
MKTKVISKWLDLIGYDYHLMKKSLFRNGPGNKKEYSLIKTTSTYSPWLSDKAFGDIFERIRHSTLVDIYRCYEIWSLVEEVLKLPGEGALLEVGVWRGGTSAIIGKRLLLLGSSEILYAADTFSGVVKSTGRDSTYKDGEHRDTSLDAVTNLLHGELGLKNIKILQGIFPEDTRHLIPPGQRFRFCHIDVDVYQSARGILDWIWEKLLPGGIVLFDDYGFITCDGITQFVNEQRKLKDRLCFYNINGHAILIKIN